jgi:hypothetical protein
MVTGKNAAAASAEGAEDEEEGEFTASGRSRHAGAPSCRGGGGESDSSVDAVDPFSRRHGSPRPPTTPPAPRPGADDGDAALLLGRLMCSDRSGPDASDSIDAASSPIHCGRAHRPKRLGSLRPIRVGRETKEKGRFLVFLGGVCFCLCFVVSTSPLCGASFSVCF